MLGAVQTGRCQGDQLESPINGPPPSAHGVSLEGGVRVSLSMFPTPSETYGRPPKGVEGAANHQVSLITRGVVIL